jgi:hypothetical protein
MPDDYPAPPADLSSRSELLTFRRPGRRMEPLSVKLPEPYLTKLRDYSERAGVYPGALARHLLLEGLDAMETDSRCKRLIRELGEGGNRSAAA